MKARQTWAAERHRDVRLGEAHAVLRDAVDVRRGDVLFETLDPLDLSRYGDSRLRPSSTPVGARGWVLSGVSGFPASLVGLAAAAWQRAIPREATPVWLT